MSNFRKKAPCNNCPYRKDAPLRLWSIEEFKDLVAKDADAMGAIYGCHKNDGHVCVGWLIDQDNRRIILFLYEYHYLQNMVTRKYLDVLGAKVPMYGSIKEMCIANYPEYFN